MFDPVWLPDSQSVAYLADDVYIVGIDGGMRRLTNDLTEKSCLAVAPTGDHLAYRTEDGVYVVDSDGTNRRQIDRNGECPTWSPA